MRSIKIFTLQALSQIAILIMASLDWGTKGVLILIVGLIAQIGLSLARIEEQGGKNVR